MVAANLSLFATARSAALLEVGLIIGAYEVAEVFLKAPFALLAHRIARVTVLRAGPVVGAAVSAVWGFPAMFWLTAGVALLVLVVVLLVVREEPGGLSAGWKTTLLDLVYLCKTP
jgi:hypothetical protein